ncbi:MICOS complex subunit Mic60 [Cimex lectularius]|uniref:MICOS complex subunit MIC60 n=1 Tax=Cimex lectularius TaxID=79782 RepID=A0A8I6RBN0_CIMLE|nr:MICOS complex subunit Mic60 [Cimex lectularius]
MFRLVRPRLYTPSPSLGPIVGPRMFRHTAKIPFSLARKLQQVQLQQNVGTLRFYRTSSHMRSKEPGMKECPKDGSGRAFYYTLGSIVLGTGVVIAYAKYDDEFRQWLKQNVPGFDEFIKFIMAEETTHVDYAVQRFIALKDEVIRDLAQLIGSKTQEEKKIPAAIADKKDDGEKKKKKYIPPSSAFVANTSEEKEKKFDEKRTSKIVGKDEEISTDPGRSRSKEARGDIDPKSLVELEAMTNIAASEAVEAYGNAICFFRDHIEEVVKVVEESVDKNDPKVWKALKQKGQDREKAVKEAEEAAKKAMKNINTLKKRIDDPDLPGGAEMRTKAKKNMDRVSAQIELAKSNYEKEKNSATVSDAYWKKVYQARSHFADELETLFPNVCIMDRNMKLSGGEFDLFILYAYQNILYYQKELNKLDTVSQLKLKSALEKSKLGDPEAIDAAIEVELEKEKRKICQEYQKRVLTMKAECEKDMRNQLRLQNNAASDLLEEALAAKEIEIEKKMKRDIEDKLAEEKVKYQEEMAAMIGRLKGMDDALRKRACQEKRAKQAQALWTAAESLLAAIAPPVLCALPSKDGQENVDNERTGPFKSLSSEIKAIRNVTRNEDELVNAVLDSIPLVAVERGVFHETALRQRFHNVVRVAKRVALLPEGGASLPTMFLAYLASLFVISPANPIPCYELMNEPFDSSELNNYEILQRAQYWMDNGDYFQVLRYMNLLQGAAQVISREFIKELTLYLETKQAGEVLATYAAAAGLPQ